MAIEMHDLAGGRCELAVQSILLADAFGLGARALHQRLGSPRSSARSRAGGRAWFGGETPTSADYILFGTQQWRRCAGRFEVPADDDPVAERRARMLGAARRRGVKGWRATLSAER